MAYTAISYLTERHEAFILIHSDTEWASAAWTMTAFYNSTKTRYDLYPVTLSGMGELTTPKTLYVHIPNPPKALRLKAGAFEKDFYFIEGGVDTVKELVYVPPTTAFTIAGVKGSPLARGGFIFFNHEPNVTFDQNAIRATLSVGDSVKGYLLGQHFYKVVSSQTTASFGFGGFLFTRCVWVDRPTSAVELDVALRVNGQTFNNFVPWNGTDFTGPTSWRFNPNANHSFYVNRFIDPFYL